jgi:hypothetical protein
VDASPKLQSVLPVNRSTKKILCPFTTRASIVPCPPRAAGKEGINLMEGVEPEAEPDLE